MSKNLAFCLVILLIGCSGESPVQRPEPHTWYRDADGDGYSDGASQTATGQPEGYRLAADLIATSGDCDDSDPAVHPDAPELFDGTDNDCDGSVDEGWLTWYRDADGDGYSDGDTQIATDQPEGYRLAADLLATSGDCDDADATVYPAAPEIYDGKDNDCNGQTDEGFLAWYRDVDGDLYSDGTLLMAVSQPEGYRPDTELIATSGDCDDTDPTVNPLAEETFDGRDNDCDGSVDEGWSVWYRDVDGDGHSTGTTQAATSRPSGHRLPAELIATSGDCDDTDSTAHPGASELFDGKDNDCDGSIDEGWSVWYRDGDGDGYSDGTTTMATAQPSGYFSASALTATSGDCDDDDPAVNPATGVDCAVASLEAGGGANFLPQTSQSIASTTNGDQMAVWLADTGTGYKVLAAFKPADADDWEAETVLTAGRYFDLFSTAIPVRSLKVQSNGTDFLVAWLEKQVGVRTNRYIPSENGWAWEGAVLLPAGNSDSYAIAASRTGYAIAVAGGQALAWIHDGDTWGSAQELGSAYGTPSTPQLVSNGTGYLAVLADYSAPYFRVWDGTAWSEPVTPPQSSYESLFDAASDGSGYAIAWGSYATPFFTATLAETAPGVWEIGDTQEITSGPIDALHIASDGQGYLAVWGYFDFEMRYVCEESRHDGSGWSVTEEITALPEAPSALQELDGADGGYALLYNLNYSSRALLLNTASSWEAPLSLPMTTDMVRPVSISATSVANRYLFSWAMGGRVYSATLDGGQWSTAKDLVKGFHRGGSYHPRITRAADGTLLATWLQKNGAGLSLLARLRVGGVWGDAVELSPFVTTSSAWGNKSGYEVASNGTDFMVAYCGSYAHLQTTRCSPSGEGIWQWSSPAGVPNFVSTPAKLVSNGNGYLLLGWGYDIWESRNDGSGWSVGFKISPMGTGSVGTVDAVSNGAEYLVVFQKGNTVYARRWDGSQWVTAATLDSGTVSYPRVAWNGTHYAALWTNGTTVKSSLLADDTWSTPSAVEAGMAGDFIGTAPGVFQAAWMQTTSPGFYSVYSATQTDGAWGTPALLGTASGTLHSPDPLLAQCGGYTEAAWTLGDAGQDVFRTARLENGLWDSPTTWSHAGRDAWFHSIAGGPGACDVAWTEGDPEDPAVYRLRLTHP